MPTQEEYDRLKRKYDEANALCDHLERQALTDDAERVLRSEIEEQADRIEKLERDLARVDAETVEELAAYDKEVRAEERERCARECETMTFARDIDWWLERSKKCVSKVTAQECAKSIRALGDE